MGKKRSQHTESEEEWERPRKWSKVSRVASQASDDPAQPAREPSSLPKPQRTRESAHAPPERAPLDAESPALPAKLDHAQTEAKRKARRAAKRAAAKERRQRMEKKAALAKKAERLEKKKTLWRNTPKASKGRIARQIEAIGSSRWHKVDDAGEGGAQGEGSAVIELLLALGADARARNEMGKTAEEWAASCGNVAALEIFRAHPNNAEDAT
eukprot:g7608.t1